MPPTTRANEAVVSAHRLPASTQGRTELPWWEVRYGCEATGWKVIGWIEERRLSGTRRPLYFPIGIHPRTGKQYRLEGNTDLDERVNAVADFHQDPMTSWQHLGSDARR